jgi:hypothetical protein
MRLQPRTVEHMRATIVKALGLEPAELDLEKTESTPVWPETKAQPPQIYFVTGASPVKQVRELPRIGHPGGSRREIARCVSLRLEFFVANQRMRAPVEGSKKAVAMR